MNIIQEHPKYMDACKQVAKDWRKLAYDIRKQDAYASHVSEEIKEANLQKDLKNADYIEAGNVDNFTIWQRVNKILTGESVALLP